MVEAVEKLSLHADFMDAGDVGKSLAFCTAPDWMMDRRKETRKSENGKRREKEQI